MDDNLRIALSLTFAVIGGFLIGWSFCNSAQHSPRLVGYNCFQASGPIYADKEDHFPPCEKIEKN